MIYSVNELCLENDVIESVISRQYMIYHIYSCYAIIVSLFSLSTYCAESRICYTTVFMQKLISDCSCLLLFFFFKQKTAYEMRISDWSSDVCSSDLDDEVVWACVAVVGGPVELAGVTVDVRAVGAGLEDPCQIVAVGIGGERVVGVVVALQDRFHERRGDDLGRIVHDAGGELDIDRCAWPDALRRQGQLVVDLALIDGVRGGLADPADREPRAGDLRPGGGLVVAHHIGHGDQLRSRRQHVGHLRTRVEHGPRSLRLADDPPGRHGVGRLGVRERRREAGGIALRDLHLVGWTAAAGTH